MQRSEGGRERESEKESEKERRMCPDLPLLLSLLPIIGRIQPEDRGQESLVHGGVHGGQLPVAQSRGQGAGKVWGNEE